MFQPSEQIRYNQCCRDAMFGYANAMAAASNVIVGQVLGLWSEAVSSSAGLKTPAVVCRSAKERRDMATRDRERASMKRRRARERARAGSRGPSPLDFMDTVSRLFAMPWLSAVEAMNPYLHDGGSFYVNGAGEGPFPGFSGRARPGFIDPAVMMGAWFDMDFSRAPGAWPMAYGMMAAGIPKTVAWPMAEANLAAFDAFNVAGVAMRRAGF